MSTQSVPVRPPAVAGTFYPGQKEPLRAQVDTLLGAAGTTGPELPTAIPKALIVPHAGYIYSGPVAASAYAHLSANAAGSEAPIERVVIVGPAHRVYVPGVAA